MLFRYPTSLQFHAESSLSLCRRWECSVLTFDCSVLLSKCLLAGDTVE